PPCRFYEQVVQPVAARATRDAWYRTWRLASLDGSSLDVGDTAGNGIAFGHPGAGHGRSAFPQLRLVALVETGMHVLFGARLGSTTPGETSSTAVQVVT
ncbi:MAG: IS4 family transposase, partial [Janthinobacterium lividum]